ncbi:TetR/AcrR family transcriptional regulator [Actinoplanes sp. NPDC051513]|uniref:TetR/AcrR family transcriptional regulator n=1 Tax=Actinoplanes sp. NPDC051513 TaxID=3363908 RepID=UPI0037B98CAA
MPAVNVARRDRLADAAVELLGRLGVRGLTHRAVDAEAGEPPGTTSRYFRTRHALMCGAAERIRVMHFADLARAPRGRLARSAVTDHLAGLVVAALTQQRTRHLAALELFLEATRRPELRAVLTGARHAQIAQMRQIHHTAGVDLTDHQAAMLVTSLTGLIFTALSTPDAIGLQRPEDAGDLVRQLVAAPGASFGAAGQL